MNAQKNILLTGRPGIGKTTLIRKFVEVLDHHNPVGFYTREIRTGGSRTGFELIDLRHGGLTLSHVKFPGPPRVGKYGVDIDRFETYLRSRDFVGCREQLVIIDEIGKMECFSTLFVDMITRLLDSQKTVIATIARKGGGAISGIRRRSDIEMVDVSAANRDILAGRLAASIEAQI